MDSKRPIYDSEHVLFVTTPQGTLITKQQFGTRNSSQLSDIQCEGVGDSSQTIHLK